MVRDSIDRVSFGGTCTFALVAGNRAKERGGDRRLPFQIGGAAPKPPGFSASGQ
jgi:hypothetical protein